MISERTLVALEALWLLHHYATPRSSRQLTTLPLFIISTNHQVHSSLCIAWININAFLVLHAIRTRYSQRHIYTYSGLALIAVNSFQRIEIYGSDFIQKYTDRKRGELEPHLFAVAEDARLHMR